MNFSSSSCPLLSFWIKVSTLCLPTFFSVSSSVSFSWVSSTFCSFVAAATALVLFPFFWVFGDGFDLCHHCLRLWFCFRHCRWFPHGCFSNHPSGGLPGIQRLASRSGRLQVFSSLATERPWWNVALFQASFHHGPMCACCGRCDARQRNILHWLKHADVTQRNETFCTVWNTSGFNAKTHLLRTATFWNCYIYI